MTKKQTKPHRHKEQYGSKLRKRYWWGCLENGGEGQVYSDRCLDFGWWARNAIYR